MIEKCPFCGNTNQDEFAIRTSDKINLWNNDLPAYMAAYNIACSCGAMGPDADTKLKAVERWNKRTKEENANGFSGN
jgi:hypothetical protein